MLKYLLLVSIFIFTGCVNNNSFSTTKRFNHISKDAVLEASKKVFTISDNQQYIIDSYRDALKVTQVKFSDMILTTDLNVNQWIIDVKQDENGTDAKLEIVSADALDLDNKTYIKNKKLHNIFWKRVEYFLNNKKVYWTRCNDNLEQLTKERGLCDDTNPVDVQKVKYPLIEQSVQAYKEISDHNLEVLKKSSMSITKSNKEDILDFEKNIIDLEATKKQEDQTKITQEESTETTTDKETVDEKDDFEKKLDSIINSVE